MFVCSSCGAESLRWAGRCGTCGEWGTLSEIAPPSDSGGRYSRGSASKSASVTPIRKISSKKAARRISLEIGEFDRVLGDGIVPGEIVLLAGEPGIGKSTLLMQTALEMAKKGTVLYVSGEESLGQISSRVERLRAGAASLGHASDKVSDSSRRSGLSGSSSSRSGKSGSGKSAGDPTKAETENVDSNLIVTDDTNVEAVVSAITEHKPVLAIIDSVQSLSAPDVASYPGSITQVRESGGRLTECAKMTDIPIILVGQVTKEGAIAGPKVLEHVVDAVVYFEGDDMGLYRILRCVKNRFGTTDEVGIFEMTGAGLMEVDDPTQILVSAGISESGTAISAIYKGSRSLFIEVQALTSPALFGSPRRIPTGLSKQRLEMLCAVLTRRAGVNVSEDDVFVNVSGGIKLDDPSADLAVCMAVSSAKLDVPLDKKVVYIGEVGLSGEVRPVPFLSRIVSEARRRKMSIIGNTDAKQQRIRDVIKPLIKKK
jgi:DNA repair protein RadA/Sms